jgi:hypothetical protein
MQWGLLGGLLIDSRDLLRHKVDVLFDYDVNPLVRNPRASFSEAKPL